MRVLESKDSSRRGRAARTVAALPVVLCLLAGCAPGSSATVSDRANQPPLVGNWPVPHGGARPVSLRAIQVGGFLGRHIDASNASLARCLESPIPKAFEARAAGIEPPPECKRLATDSDMYKWLEGACYALAYEPDRADLRAIVEKYADLIVRLQEPDGWIGTRLAPAAPFDERVRHDLYVAGHLFEAAVAHHAATGSRRLLDAAVRLADFYLRAFQAKHPYYKLIGQEHPEIELALVRLGRATGQDRFITFARDLTHLAQLTPPLRNVRAGGGRLHAVRLCYQLTGVAELFLQAGECDEWPSVTPLWEELITTRTYVTGGIGCNEHVPDEPYDLPQTFEKNPNRDVAETCASVSLMMLSWRVHGVTGQARPFEVIERILYNHCLGALSPDHAGNFYYNPLRRVGDLSARTDHGGDPVRRTRLPAIHSTACCLPNAWRFFAQLPEYVLSVRGDTVLVNLYTEADARVRLDDGRIVEVAMSTRYPDDGTVTLRVKPQQRGVFTLGLRIPMWAQGATLRINRARPQPVAPGEYARVTREWGGEDRIQLDLPMKPIVLTARTGMAIPVEGVPEVRANAGQAAFQRGPLIYCLEQPEDSRVDLGRVEVSLNRTNPAGDIEARWDGSLPSTVLQVPLVTPGSTQPLRATLIPFYLRANRDDATRWLTWIPVSRR